MVALGLFVAKTRTGRAMQATAQDPDTAKLMGINTDRIIVIAFAIGAAFAAVAAVAYGLNNGQIDFDMGFLMGLKAFTAAVLGGIGNIYGAMLGGLVLGVAESLATGYISDVPGMDLFGGGARRVERRPPHPGCSAAGDLANPSDGRGDGPPGCPRSSRRRRRPPRAPACRLLRSCLGNSSSMLSSLPSSSSLRRAVSSWPPLLAAAVPPPWLAGLWPWWLLTP